MTDEAWSADFVRSVGMLLSGTGIEEVDEHGEPIIGDTLLLLLSAHDEAVRVHAARSRPGASLAATVRHGRSSRGAARTVKSGAGYALQGRSVALFKVTPPVVERRRGFGVAAAAARLNTPAAEPSAAPQTDDTMTMQAG